MGSNYKEDLIVRIKSTFRTENTASLVMDVERTERVLLWPIETPALKCGGFSQLADFLPRKMDGGQVQTGPADSYPLFSKGGMIY